MKVLFAGGVTGGHIAPGVALAERVLRVHPGSEVLFASVANEVEERMIARRGLALTKIAERPTGRAAAALGIPRAWLRARRLFASFRPDVVVGLGAGASLGPAIAAITSRRPLVLLEQNAVPGRTNRWLASRAAQVCCQWECAARKLGGRAKPTGNPVRSEILEARTLDRAESRKFFKLDPDVPTLLVMGGSQGAHAINMVMIEAAGRLAGEKIQVIHAAGQADSPTVFHAYRAAALAAHVSSFLETMHLAYAAADLAISRAGATSIAELAVAGLPAILVPYPYAKDDHQRANGRGVAEQGWGVMVDQADLGAKGVAELIKAMLADRAKLSAMRQAALASACEDADEVIVKTLHTLASGAEEAVTEDAEKFPAGEAAVTEGAD